LLRRGAATLADIPRAGDVMAKTAAPRLDEWTADPAGVLLYMGLRIPLFSRVFIQMGLGNFAWRLALCSTVSRMW
jgi:hypothetical protein